MIYGYLRVSTDEQDVNSQRTGVDHFAKEKGMVIDEYITDEGISGGTNPDKRNLGPLLKKICKGDIIIASEISRLGRDLFMVMDILHLCMEREAKVYTVKDHYELGDDIQSKVLAFAFGLSAEIERQMIKQRTREGLRRRVALGILLGRPPMAQTSEDKLVAEKSKDQILYQYEIGVPVRRIAKNFGIDRNTLDRALARWKVKESKYAEKQLNSKLGNSYKDGNFKVVPLCAEKVIELIRTDKTIPEIANQFPEYTYEQVYDTIYCNAEYNTLYRSHGQKLIKQKR